MSRCLDCEAPISAAAVRCRQCANRHINSDPEIAERRLQAIRRLHKDPEFRRRHIARAMQRLEEWRQTPGAAEAMRRQGEVIRAISARPEVRAKWMAGRKEAGRKRTDTVLAWCPDRLRDEYRRLQKYPYLKSAGARKRIEAMITPFERQLLKVKAGAGIVNRFVPPPRSYDYTLGGVTDL